MPFTSVNAGLPVTLPLPSGANVTTAPCTGLPDTSVTTTAGAMATAVPAVTVCPSPASMTTRLAVPTVADAVNTTVPKLVAASSVLLLTPATDPSVQLPTVAMPFDPVVAGLPETLPPPAVTVNVTDTPATGLSNPSVTNTAGDIGTAVPISAVCPSPA